jgi:hypothetical protein
MTSVALYELAADWLRSIEVDVAKLEQEHTPLVTQRVFHPQATGLNPEERKN